MGAQPTGRLSDLYTHTTPPPHPLGQVLRVFEYNVTIEDADGKKKPAHTIGIVFVSKRVGAVYLDLIRKGVHIKLAVQADGTYKIHNGGWALSDLGTHIIAWDEAKRKHVHKFQPLLYMFSKTKCIEAYTAFFETFKYFPMLLGMPTITVEVTVGGLDRSTAIASAYLAIWPQITLTQCWPHIARKIREGECRKRLHDSAKMEQIASDILLLHAARSKEQF